jgi:hypothetical protein
MLVLAVSNVSFSYQSLQTFHSLQLHCVSPYRNQTKGSQTCGPDSDLVALLFNVLHFVPNNFRIWKIFVTAFTAQKIQLLVDGDVQLTSEERTNCAVRVQVSTETY